jgi:predicted lipoprotein with Yx(FWY)xxD motif
MSRVLKTMPLVVFFVLMTATQSAWAYWVQHGVALSTAAGTQWGPMITSDGAGGSIATWRDDRSGIRNIYAQKVDALGTVLWTVDGVALCTAGGEQEDPLITSDGAGGAIVIWLDSRSGRFWDIYAQRVNSSGVVQWTANGVPLYTAGGAQDPQITSDGSGGAILTWYDNRSGNYDIYAQRVNASGVAQWTVNGVAICTAAQDQQSAQITSDGVGGAIVVWKDYRSGTNWDIYAQRLNTAGSVQWTANGVVVCAATGDQQSPQITSDGAHGAIFTWEDHRSGSNWDVYAQRVSAGNHVEWTANGVALCTATGDQQSEQITSDGVGGAIVVWKDYRGANADIYAQDVNAIGTVQWTVNGIAICTAGGDQYTPKIISDGSGGAVLAWQDDRNYNSSVYLQRIDLDGVPGWGLNGMSITSFSWTAGIQQLVTDGVGGAIVAWDDFRSFTTYDIYAQRIERNGYWGYPAPRIQAVRDVPGDQGGYVNLAWNASRLDPWPAELISKYSVWRAISPTKSVLALENGASSIDDLSKLDLSSGKPLVRIDRAAGRTFYWELMQTVDAMYMPAYAKPVTTLFDSTTICKEYTYFQVVAHTTTPTVFWASVPDSGRSVDNIAPGVPKALAGEQSYTPVGLDLTWDKSIDADLGHYAVYRGTSAGFVPGSGNLIASPKDTTLLDSSWRWNGGYYYKVSAIDIHGNESGFALLTPDNVTGTETPKAPAASYLAQNYPNPFNPTTRIAFGLSAPGHVSLRIYDAAGRLVRMFAEGTRPAANYVEVWDGKDASGRAVASGIYFCRLDAGSFTQTKKMILLR